MPTDISHLADARARERALLDRVRRDYEHTPQPRHINPEQTIVTISREYGAGGHSVAEKLIERLGPEWQVWDKEIVDEVARSAKVRAELAAGLDEHMLSVQEQVLRYLVNCWALSPDRYYHHLAEVLVAISHRGCKIIIGRGANFALPAALRIRLCASDKHRIDVIASREGLTADAARTKMKAIDRERAAFVSSLFGRDINEPTAYDIIFRMDHIAVDAAAAAIEGAVRARLGAGLTIPGAHRDLHLSAPTGPG